MGLLAKGLSNNEIAHKLSLSLETVKWYNKHIFSKLGVSSRMQAVAKAVAFGILAPAEPAVVPSGGPGGGLAPGVRGTGHGAVTRPAGGENQLPGAMTSFIGREKELREVEKLVARARLVTITGAGGLGKMRLALQAAARMTTGYLHGVRWVTFAALYDGSAPGAASHAGGLGGIGGAGATGVAGAAAAGGEGDVVTQAVAKVLRVFDHPGVPLLLSVVESLRDQNLLLVLDNCEHLIAACAALAERILSDCPKVSLLVTSREALGVPGEKAWRLPPLALPGVGAGALDEGAVLGAEAVRLFVERAADAQPGYQPAAGEAAILAQICQRLDGIPLAIELAAARMNLLAPREIAARLDRRFSLLTGGHRTALPRHQTLLAAIEWSYDLLGAEEKCLFRRLAVFTGSFTLAAAEAICPSPDLPADSLITLLGRLVDKSLLNVEPAPPDSGLATRYRCLDTIHSFGRMKLEEAGEGPMLHEAHAEYYARLVEAADHDLLLPDVGHWFKVLRAEYDNVRAAIEWCIESDEPVLDMRLVSVLAWFWWYDVGSGREGQALTRRVLGLESTLQYPALRARILNTAGYLNWYQGDVPAARRLIEEALAIEARANEAQGDTVRSAAISKQLMAMVLISEGQYPQAERLMHEGVTIAQQLGDPSLRVYSLAFQGDLFQLKGERSTAMRIHAENVGLLRMLGSKFFLPYPLRRLGFMLLEDGDVSRAWPLFAESLACNQEVGDRRAVAACLASMAALALRLGQPERAARLVGVVMARLAALATTLMYMDQVELERVRAGLAPLMGAAALAAAEAEGGKLNEGEVGQVVAELAAVLASLSPVL